MGPLVLGAAVVAAGACATPPASVGATRADGGVEVRVKACGGDGVGRVDVVDPAAPEDPVWSAHAEPGRAADRVPIAAEVDGYEVVDDRGAAFGATEVRVLVEGEDGGSWGGPRVVPDKLEEGTLRVAGQDVALAEWEQEPARCPRVTVLGALAGGVATAAAAGVLWLVVRGLARLVGRTPDRR
ncbi:hypothetical protein PO878_06340 [Iamia majanohamensis]|uniref:Uncharacterized protein n=1 Tax=Iamia majanohamensis TaxID=467976 RepID=A0AAF0BSH9_9ACTN|nr:hypothetical protein [Iamia majanohamensis]WCO68346.1 hypothetical protein PO878_06340 [Iamia majanohamensis]